MGIMNKKKGIRTTPYCTHDEIVQLLKLSTLSNELKASAEDTRDKSWKRMMNCASGLVWKVVSERLKYVDSKQATTIVRRSKHSVIKMITSDEDRRPDNDALQEKVTVGLQDLFDIYDLAANNCAACPQGECVKECFYRKNFHRLGLPVSRADVKDGECEFNWQEVGVTSQIVPQNKRVSHYYEEDYIL